MLSFLLGAAAIALPQGTAPIVVGAAALKTAAALRRRLRRKREAKQAANGGSVTYNTNTDISTDNGAQHVPPVELRWHNLSATLKADKKNAERRILRGVSGVASPGRLLAIMGPSGSGKTTLLSALAGEMGRSQRLKLSGAITVNGVPASSRNHRQAFVQQADLFFSMLTVSETLDMAAKMGLPADMAAEQKQARVDDITKVLGLGKTLPSRVGDKKNRGISGGERKRLSIGCELISGPSLLFLDEPTTGLDAFQAEKVVATLRQLAVEGRTVVCSIHQPRSSIFNMFDDLLLVAEGEVVYSGPAADALEHFAALGHVCGEHINPAEFFADLISVDTSSPEAEADSKAHVASLTAAWRQRSANAAAAATANGAAAASGPLVPVGEVKPAGPLTQFRLLLRRSWRQVTRDKAAAVSRAMSNVSSAIIFGAIYFRMSRKQSTVQDRLGLLQVSAINCAMSSLIKTLNVFPTERTLVTRERAKQSYGVLPYLSAKLAAELPISAVYPLLFGSLVYPLCGLNPSWARFLRFQSILTLESFASAALGLTVGAFAPSTEAAIAIGPAVMVIFIVFGGLYVNSSNVPVALRWLPQASLIKQSFQALCVNEFKGATFELDAPGSGMADGDAVLRWLSFNKDSGRTAMLGQTRILAFWWWATYCILKSKKPAFQPMEAPAEGKGEDGASAAVPLAVPPAGTDA